MVKVATKGRVVWASSAEKASETSMTESVTRVPPHKAASVKRGEIYIVDSFCQ